MLWKGYRKRKALERYRHVLGPRLRGLHGAREHYTPREVVATARREQLPEDYLCYAIAMYCDRASFDAYHVERGEVGCSYERMWAELSASVTGQVPAASGCADDGADSGDVDDVAAALADASSVDAGGFESGGFDGGDASD